MKLKPYTLLIFCFLLCTLIMLQPAGAKRPVVITLMMHEVAVKNEIQLIREFNLTHPNIQVNVISIGVDSTDAQFENFIDYFMLNPSQVDLMFIDIIRPAEYALLDWAAPLDVFANENYLADFLEAPLEACRYQGRLYALPVFINGGLLFYRKDLLLKERMSPPRTLDDLVKQAKLLSKKYGLTGFVFQGAAYEGLVCDYLEYVIAHNGNLIVEPDNIVINTTENEQALQFMVDLIHKHQITPPPKDLLEYNETLSEMHFKAGNAAFLRTWQPFIHFSQEEPTKVRNVVDFDTIPGKKAGVFASTLGGWTLAMNTYSQHPREAWEVMKYLVSARSQDKRLQNSMDFPSRRLDAMERELGMGEVQIARIQSYLEETRPRPKFPFYRVISLTLQKYVHEALKKKITPAEALTAIQKEITDFVDEIGPAFSSLVSYEPIPLTIRKPVLIEAHKQYLIAYLNYTKLISEDSGDSQAARTALQTFKQTLERYRQTYRIILEEKVKLDKTTLRYAMGPDITTFDPHNAMDDPTFRIHKHLYDTLVEFSPHMQPVPLLAKRWEQSDNGLTWTFYLREGVVFHDGTPFNAQAVKANFDRLLNPENKLRRRKLFQAINRVEVIDDNTVRFSTATSFAPLLNYLGHNAGSIISPKAFSDDNKTFQPVGTGPYRFKEWQPGKRVLLEHNPGYFLGAPAVPRLEFIPIPDDESRANYLEQGQVDIIYPIPSDRIDPFNQNEKIEILEKESLRTLYLGFNLSRPPFDSAQLRKAVAAAIDTREILWSDLRAHGQVATSVAAPLTFGHTPVGTYEFNLERSLELLSKAGKIEGFTTELIVPRGRFFMAESVAESIKESLQLVDIEVEIKLLDWADYEKALSRPRDEATHQMYLFGWSPTSGDADNVIRLLFHSDHMPPEGTNRMFYHDKKVDELISQALEITDPEKRKSLYSNIQTRIHRDVPCISLFVLNQTFAVNKRVKGLELIPNEIIRLRNATLED